MSKSKISDFKVYRINDCDWVMARSLAEAVGTIIIECGVSVEEVYDKDSAHELSPAQLRKTRFCWEGPRGGTHHHSFAKELSLRDPVPQLFASTEF